MSRPWTQGDKYCAYGDRLFRSRCVGFDHQKDLFIDEEVGMQKRRRIKLVPPNEEGESASILFETAGEGRKKSLGVMTEMRTQRMCSF